MLRRVTKRTIDVATRAAEATGAQPAYDGVVTTGTASAFDFMWHVPVVPVVVAAQRADEVEQLVRVEGLGQ